MNSSALAVKKRRCPRCWAIRNPSIGIRSVRLRTKPQFAGCTNDSGLVASCLSAVCFAFGADQLNDAVIDRFGDDSRSEEAIRPEEPRHICAEEKIKHSLA